ncbi:hypothetical protein BH23CHL5_BH23CHL5_21040 [soil metagenome]
MVSTVGDEAIKRGTGKPWSEWKAYFESRNAASMDHKSIAAMLQSEAGLNGWWAQTVTVRFEQLIGRREPGQDCNGEFSVSVTKTINGDMDVALAWWLDAVLEIESFSDIPLARDPEISKTENWRYWRAALSDGTRVNVNIYEKAPEKSSLSVMHVQLESTDQIEHWRSYWKAFLKNAATKT